MRQPLALILVVLMLVLAEGCALIGGASSSEPNAAQLNFELGVGYMQQGDYNVALEKLKKALEFNEKYPEAHNAIAVLYEETKDNALAEEHFRRAIELDSNYALAKLNYGRFLCATGKYAEGESQLLAVRKNSNSGKITDGAYTGAGYCARLAGDREQAENYLRKALEQNPNSAAALYELAELSHAQGKDLQARAFLQRYHGQVGYSAASLWLGVQIEDTLGGGDLRREYARTLLANFPASDEAHHLKP